MAERHCEDCGRRMESWVPRRRKDGQRVCSACHARPRGGLVNAQPPAVRGAPFPLRASTAAYEDSLGIDLDQPSVVMKGKTIRDRIEFHRQKMQGVGYDFGPDEVHDLLGDEKGGRYYRESSLQVEAHDSSQDPTGVFHCPFCGGGQLVGNGDGSIQCVFCNSNFTVQKQPQFPGIPQTQNGMQMPPPRAEQDRINDYAQGQDPNLGPVGPADPTPDPAQFAPGLSDKPQVIVESYLTPAGVAVDHETYLRHLALAFAGDDRDAVLAQVRASRQKEH